MTHLEPRLGRDALLCSAFGHLLFDKWPDFSDQLETDDDRVMYRALELAARGIGRTHPNPPVGAVVFKSGKIIAEAHHEFAGIVHAEAQALNAAGEQAAGAEIYITLEPCTHTSKRTPPCINQVLKSGVVKARLGALDPNPNVNGNGLKRLLDASIDAKISGDSFVQKLATNIIAPFSTGMKKQRPYIVLKVASSLDGCVARAQGEQTAITSKPADLLVHRLRDGCDAITVGRGTVAIDNPRLTARDIERKDEQQPLRVIFDSSLSASTGAKVFSTKDCVVVHDVDAPVERQNAFDSLSILRIGVVRDANGRLGLLEALQELWKLGITSILVEGGPQLWTSFINAGLVDEIWWFSSPVVFGANGLSSLLALTPDAQNWINLPIHNSFQTSVGPDHLTIIRIQKPL